MFAFCFACPAACHRKGSQRQISPPSDRGAMAKLTRGKFKAKPVVFSSTVSSFLRATDMICSSAQQIEHVLRKPSISSDRSSACRCLNQFGVSKSLLGSSYESWDRFCECFTPATDPAAQHAVRIRQEMGGNGTEKITHISASSADNTSDRMALLLLRVRTSAV